MWTTLSIEKVRANRVREIREEQLITRDELARRAGVSLRTIWSVEAGRDCRLETKRSILRALGISRNQHRSVFPRPGDTAARPVQPRTDPVAATAPAAPLATGDVP